MSVSPLRGWLPGVLSGSQVQKLCDVGWIENFKDEKLFDASAVDLTLSGEGFRMRRGSIKPFGQSYDHFVLSNCNVAERITPDGNGAFRLKAKETVVFRLQQELGSELRATESLYGQATAKSSVGRVDVLARLIVDGMDSYEYFDPDGAKKGKGKLYVEITPITFDVLVKEGISLSQLRLFYGSPENCQMRGKELYSSVLIGSEPDGCLSVDLTDTTIAEKPGCAFYATPTTDPPIPLWTDDSKPSLKPDPHDYWKLLQSEALGQKNSLTIKKESFYILRSKEKICLPKGIAVYCRAIDETIGEMRIHYAGFVHPGFGLDRGDGEPGTPLIFEVRGHDVQVVLTDGEKMARLIFYRLSEESKPGQSPYGKQTLELSKFFAPWT